MEEPMYTANHDWEEEEELPQENSCFPISDPVGREPVEPTLESMQAWLESLQSSFCGSLRRGVFS